MNLAELKKDITTVSSIRAVPVILNIVCRLTGMRFAAVARVTESQWIACSVHDEIAFGLTPGDELKVESTLCHEIRQTGRPVVINNVSEDPVYFNHHTPRIYSLKSYISMPIWRPDGTFFGTLCAIDPEVHKLDTPDIIEMFEMFAEVIGTLLSAADCETATAIQLSDERATSALREQFIAILGHDLRNPLTAIDSGMRVLLRTPLNERATTVIQMVQTSIRRMNALIGSVMDFARSRLGDGIILNRTTNAALSPMLEQVITELQTSEPERVINTSLTLPQQVDCDPHRIGELVSNLVGNALTYGLPDKPITVTASTNADELEIAVSNSGPPIPAEIMPQLFEPFTRGSMQGLGLGLYICQKIAKAHDGIIEAISTPSETRFTFRMPLK
ncbi:signal transduction histidine kinase [Gluconobacter thailandicus F149-1 = NBRC 100600]|uniref:histidine kinase n=1 Tax=Gluconobacter thailandicus NBRC 3257 TaxID=1381097 RepID=A0ABQ0J1K3_GLUTH|nr:histidine kinase [Gluconobacter thailandicus]GAD28327.1 two component sensor histidine kinase [Gluconobacter thailandicus NBRC 3257]GAN94821.1 signal transduction histidine kinase [Gluconobacter thailandicus F149-1 = NBRC 100600]GBR60471.1 sensor histidine kinase [Gluconobacter thailandicus F149-1 = NBRC 100600]GEL88730.1 sensor histidine kinase [Gluconobacter thailandicus F149-1 = NBRC 100600]